MKKFLLLFTYGLSLISYAFSQEIEWQKTIGGNAEDELHSICQTSDGGYILGGDSKSAISGDKAENGFGGYDYWVIKLDYFHNITWQRTLGGSNDDIIYSVLETTDGGYICAGHSGSGISGNKTDSSFGGWDYWVVKLDASGNIIWQKTLGGTNNENLFSAVGTPDNGVVCAGRSNSDISGNKTDDVCANSTDYWIVKLGASGNIQWQNSIGGSGSDELLTITQASDGGYICGGASTSLSSCDKNESSLGGDDYWVVKLDSAGNVEWENDIGGTNSDILYSIIQANDEGYLLGGYSWSGISGDKTENTCDSTGDWWIIKLNTIGNIEWQNTIGGLDMDYLRGVTLANEDGFFCAGYTRSDSSCDKSENLKGVDDYWFAKLDTSGNIIWDKTIGGSAFDRFNVLESTADGECIGGGWSNSNISGDKTENCKGSWDYWVVKLTSRFNSITGKLFADLNNNNIQDTGEAVLLHKKVTEINTGMFSFSQNTGVYYVNILDSGNYWVYPPAINYYNPVPSLHNAHFSGIQQTDSLNDFAFQPAGVFNDLCVTITPMGNFRANMNANYMISYENVGTTTLNGTVIFFPDNDITFVSANPNATSVTTDSVVWNVGTLTPFQTGSILVTVHVNAGTPIGTLINSSVVIEPVAGDANTACNYNAYEVFVTGSFDPNAILVDRDTVLTTELSSPPYLNYIIYFQNTGNDTAFNVRVLNNIPLKLDVNSFEFVASSHPVNIEYGAHSRLFTFTFDNILLPDSNVNEPASHGFIRYRIKPKSTLVAGDLIKNNAAIYFDFNQPVMTDTAVTEIVMPTGEEEFKVQSLKFKVFPNPVKDELFVNSYSLAGKKGELKIFDLFGREVSQLQTLNFKPQTKINVSRFSQGIYFVEMQSGEQVLRGKFLKQ